MTHGDACEAIKQIAKTICHPINPIGGDYVKINYQIASGQFLIESNNPEFPDYENLIRNASCDEEVDYIRTVQKANIKFAFNMVYITRQACGHFEIFQTPQNDYYTLETILKTAEETAKTRKCTRCICNWKT